MEILATATAWAAPVLSALGRASLHGAVAIAAVWAVCRLFPRLPAALRCGLWWLACLKLLVALVWVEPISLAVLPEEMVASQAEKDIQDIKDVKDSKDEEAPVAAVSFVSFKSFRSFDSPAPASLWPLAFVALWGAGLLLQLGLTVRQLAAARRIVRTAAPVTEPWIAALFARLRKRLGVRRADLLASPEVDTPQVSGAWRPRVLLPRRAIGSLSPQELALTLGHELLHVRRGDLWLGWIPALAQRLFFFHPLAALATREYAVAREAACDAAVLRVLDPAPEAYGRLLLRLGVTGSVPQLAAAGAAPTFQTLKRRLEMLQQSADKKRVHPGWWGLLALLAVAALVPIQMVAAQAPEPPAAPEAIPSVPAVPAVAAVPAAPPNPSTLPVVQVAQRGTPPTPPVPPTPPTPPTKGSWMSFGNGEHWVLVQDEESVTMSGDTRDVKRAREHYSGKPILWFKRNGKSYVIRDQATVARAQSFFEPQRELGERQGALGEQQGKLGEQQGHLGAEMGSHGARIGALAAQQAAHAVSRDEDDDEGLDELDEELEKLSGQMEALGRQQEALGRQQEALGRQQEELGRQQEKIAREGERQLRALIDQAVANGTAQEVDK